MKNICLTFQVHQPVRLKKYRFFDIGNDDYYYDDFNNEKIIRKLADDFYLPTNKILLELLKKHKGQFKVAFSISGTAIDQFSSYAPEVIKSFQALSATGCVEFLAETYAYSLASLKNEEEFKRQVEAHSNKMEELFGQLPQVFKNTELIYSDEIGAMVAEMGFKAVLTEGARHILKWRSPNYLYYNSIIPFFRVLLKNSQLSEDIAFRLSNADWTGWPTTENNYLSVLNKISAEEKIVNLFMDYETVGQYQKKGKGIYNFLESFPSAVFEMTEYGFMTPSEIVCYNQPISTISVPEPIFRMPYERDLSVWPGNELQQEALNKLYESSDKIARCTDPVMLKDWQFLQSIDHFNYMSVKQFRDLDLIEGMNPYENFYEAFMNYMNVLNDFIMRLTRPIANLQSDFILKKMQQPVRV